MLLNEFLKAHRKLEEQQGTISQQQQAINTLTVALKEQTAQIQQVSARLAANEAAARVSAMER